MPDIKLFDDLDHTLFDIIDAADENGRAHFIKPKKWLPYDVSLKSKAALARVVSSTLMDHTLFCVPCRSWTNRVDVSKVELEDGSWLMGFSVTKFLYLPGLNPKEELAELRKLFEAMLPFFEANAELERPAVIRAMNNRDSKGRVYGTFSAIAGGKEPADFIQLLQSMVDSSTVLQHFQRHLALSLSKVGRYAWGDLRGNVLYPANETPWELAYYAKKYPDRETKV